MKVDKNQQKLSPVENTTELFSILNSQNSEFSQDSLIETDLQNKNLSKEDAIKYAKTLISSDISGQQLAGTTMIHRLLNKITEDSFKKVIQSKFLPLLIKLIPKSDEPLTYEILWIFLHVTEWDKLSYKYLHSINLLGIFNSLLQKSVSIRIFNQIICAIGNIAYKSNNNRDILWDELDLQAISDFLNAYENQFSIQDLKSIAWCLNCLTDKKPVIDLDKAKLFIPILRKIIINIQDEDILKDALASHSKITETISNINLYFDPQLLNRIIYLLDSQNIEICQFSLGNITNCTFEKLQPDFVLNQGLLQKLIQFIDSDFEDIRKEAYFALSNIVIDNNIYFSHLIDLKFFEKFRNTLENDSESIQSEAIRVFCNLTIVFDAEQANWIIENRYLELVLERLFTIKDICDAVFESLLNLFKFKISAEKVQHYWDVLKNVENHIWKNEGLSKVLERLADMQ